MHKRPVLKRCSWQLTARIVARGTNQLRRSPV
jgi:hypothetical protein